MNRSITKLAPVVLAVAAALSGCGSSHDDGGTTTPPTKTTDVPPSAQASVAGLIAYMNDLIANMTNDTSEPILVGDAVLPTSDTTEPVN